MADLASARAKIQSESVDFDSPVTEQLLTQIGADINYLIDERDTLRADIDSNDADILSLQNTAARVLIDSWSSVSLTTVYQTIAQAPSGSDLKLAAVAGDGASINVVEGGETVVKQTASLNYLYRISGRNLQAKYSGTPPGEGAFSSGFVALIYLA